MGLGIFPHMASKDNTLTVGKGHKTMVLSREKDTDISAISHY
jgi:hypothetical protein